MPVSIGTCCCQTLPSGGGGSGSGECPPYCWYTVYAHLDRIDVTVDQIVERGDVIGQVGQIGTNMGPHLHFAVGVESLGWSNIYDVAVSVDIYSALFAPQGQVGERSVDTSPDPLPAYVTQDGLDFILDSLIPPLDLSFCSWYEQMGSVLHDNNAYWAQDWKCLSGDSATELADVHVMSGGDEVTSTVISLLPEYGGVVIQHCCECSSCFSSEEISGDVSSSGSSFSDSSSGWSESISVSESLSVSDPSQSFGSEDSSDSCSGTSTSNSESDDSETSSASSSSESESSGSELSESSESGSGSVSESSSDGSGAERSSTGSESDGSQSESTGSGGSESASDGSETGSGSGSASGESGGGSTGGESSGEGSAGSGGGESSGGGGGSTGSGGSESESSDSKYFSSDSSSSESSFSESSASSQSESSESESSSSGDTCSRCTGDTPQTITAAISGIGAKGNDCDEECLALNGTFEFVLVSDCRWRFEDSAVEGTIWLSSRYAHLCITSVPDCDGGLYPTEQFMLDLGTTGNFDCSLLESEDWIVGVTHTRCDGWAASCSTTI